MDWKLELVIIPVSDVDRAKAFYERVGFNADHDHRVTPELRFVQLTPPGSACSIALGTGLTDAPLGSARAQIVVADVAARARRARRARHRGERRPAPSPGASSSSSSDPDGNRWSLQELGVRN